MMLKVVKSRQDLRIILKMIKRFLTIICFVILVCSVVPFSYYLNFGHLNVSDKPENWGAFGDFIGGILNPLLSFAAFSSILLTIYLQREQLNQNQQQLVMTREELSLSTAELKRSADAQSLQIEAVKLQNFESTFFHLLSRFEAQSAHLIRVYLKNEVEEDSNVPSSFERDRDIRYCGYEHLRYELYKYQKYYSSEQYGGENPERCGSREAYEGISHQGIYQIVLDEYFQHLSFIFDFITEGDIDDKRKYYRILFSEMTNGELIFVFYQVLYNENFSYFKIVIEDNGLFEYIGYKGLIDGSHDLRKYMINAYGNNRWILANLKPNKVVI